MSRKHPRKPPYVAPVNRLRRDLGMLLAPRQVAERGEIALDAQRSAELVRKHLYEMAAILGMRVRWLGVANGMARFVVTATGLKAAPLFKPPREGRAAAPAGPAQVVSGGLPSLGKRR